MSYAWDLIYKGQINIRIVLPFIGCHHILQCHLPHQRPSITSGCSWGTLRTSDFVIFSLFLLHLQNKTSAFLNGTSKVYNYDSFLVSRTNGYCLARSHRLLSGISFKLFKTGILKTVQDWPSRAISLSCQCFVNVCVFYLWPQAARFRHMLILIAVKLISLYLHRMFSFE